MKTENKTKKSLTQLQNYCFEKKKKMLFSCIKNADISKIKGTMILKGIFSKTTYACVLPYQISSFYHSTYEF